LTAPAKTIGSACVNRSSSGRCDGGAGTAGATTATTIRVTILVPSPF
jgi:hypothetical protein